MKTSSKTSSEISFEDFRDQILKDYEIAYLSRTVSLLGRKEVLTGKAKFGIFGGWKRAASISNGPKF